MASSPMDGDMVVSSTTTHISSSSPDANPDDMETEEDDVLAFHPLPPPSLPSSSSISLSVSLPVPPPAHSASMPVTSQSSTSSSSIGDLSVNSFPIGQQQPMHSNLLPPPSVHSHASSLHPPSFRIQEDQEQPQQLQSESEENNNNTRRLLSHSSVGHQHQLGSQHHSSSSSSSPHTPDDVADIDSTTNEHNHARNHQPSNNNDHSVQYLSLSSSSQSSARLLSNNNQVMSETGTVPSYSDAHHVQQQQQLHLQSSYYDHQHEEEQHIEQQQQQLGPSQQQQQQNSSSYSSGSSSALSSSAIQQLQQLLMQQQSSSSTNVASELIQQGNNNNTNASAGFSSSQSQQQPQLDYNLNSESSQQQIFRLYHQLQESSASLAVASSNSLETASLDDSVHINPGASHSWQQQQQSIHQTSMQQQQPQQHLDPNDIQLNDYEDEDDEDDQGLDLVAPPAHQQQRSQANTSHPSSLHHHHFLMPSVISLETQASQSMRQMSVHVDPQAIAMHSSGGDEGHLQQSLGGMDSSSSSSAGEIVISDVPVESRARASLPSAYLFIDIVMDINEGQDLSDGFNSLSSGPVIYGVFARKMIPERTQFGPVEGVISSFNSKSHLFNNHQPNLIVFISDSLILDQADENKSNWMRFVRTATSSSQQNLILVTKEQTQPNPDNENELITTTKFYFMTTKCINSRDELRVWYSKDYADRFRLKLLDDIDVVQQSSSSSSSSSRKPSSPTDLSLFRSTASAPPSMSVSGNHFGGHSSHSQHHHQGLRMVHQDSLPLMNNDLDASHLIEQQHQQQHVLPPPHSSAGSFNLHSHQSQHLSTPSYSSTQSHPHQLHHVQPIESHHHDVVEPLSDTSLAALDPVPIEFNVIAAQMPPTSGHLVPSSSSANLQDSSSYLQQESHYQEHSHHGSHSLSQPSASSEVKEPATAEMMTSSSAVSLTNSMNNNHMPEPSRPSSSTSMMTAESPSASLIPATPPSASGGHKLRNKIAKSQQLQQLQLLKQHKDGSVSKKDGSSEATSTRPTSSGQSSTLTSSTTSSSYSHQHKCDTCGKAFNRFYSLRRHQIMHSGEKKFKCPVCNMSFSHVYNRNRHVKRHANRSNGMMRRMNQQQTVSVSATTVSEKDSIKGNQENVQINCVPKIEGESESSQQESIKRSDSNCSTTTTRIILIGNNPNKPYKCGTCYKCFTTEDRLIKHALVHSGDDRNKPFSCNVCLKRFLNNSALSCHLKIHLTPKDEPRRYDCIFCGGIFDSPQSRKEHLVKHLEGGRFPCTHCKKKFDEFTAVRKHIRAFHSDRQYPCPVCAKIFPRPDKLKLHMLKHSDHREFLCQACGKQFKRKDKLKEHIVRMHAPDRDAKIAAKAAAKAAAVEAATAQLRAAVESASAAISASQQQPSSSTNTTSSKKSKKESKKEEAAKQKQGKKFVPKVSPNDYQRFIYKCHSCQLGFKRRGMLVNHLAKRHPETSPDAVPELNLPILKTTRDYFCQYCDKVYKSSSKRKAHILKNHPGRSLPLSNRHKGGIPLIPGIPNPTFSAPVGAVPTNPQYCNWCHKQYASKAKLLQHQRKKHPEVQSKGSNNNNNNSNSGKQKGKGNSIDIKMLNNEVASESLTPNNNEYVDHLAYITTQGPLQPQPPQPVCVNTNSVSASNLMSILGSLAASGESSVAADLQELLQANPLAANDILNQAMAELTSNQHQQQPNTNLNHLILNQSHDSLSKETCIVTSLSGESQATHPHPPPHTIESSSSSTSTTISVSSLRHPSSSIGGMISNVSHTDLPYN